MEGANSSAIYHNGKYYYTHETNEQIYLWVTTDITDMAHSTCKEVWVPKDPSNSHNLWNPEIRNINGNGISISLPMTETQIIIRFT